MLNHPCLVVVHVGDGGPTPVGVLPMPPARSALPPSAPIGIVAPPSPKRAKPQTHLHARLAQIRAEIRAAGYEADTPHGVYDRTGNRFGHVLARRKENGAYLTLGVHVFYDGTYAAEVTRWSTKQPGRLPGGVLREDAPLERGESFQSASLPDALAWR